MATAIKKKLPTLAGKPLDTNILTREIAGPSLVSIRSTFSERLERSLTLSAAAGYIMEAQQGYGWNWLDVCNGMERNWPHFRAVLATRKGAVLGLERRVDPASNSPAHVAHADFIRRWVKQDKFVDFMFDLLDAIAKPFAVCEFVAEYNTFDKTWTAKTTAWRDPRWFSVDPNDGESLLIRDNSGDYPIKNIPMKFIVHRAKSSSGFLMDDGLCRVLIKPFVVSMIIEKFWPAFLELYGMPTRVGTLKAGSNADDKTALLAALAGLGADAAAVITDQAEIEFMHAPVGASSEVFKAYLDYQNDQASKVCLGQTFTMGGSGTSGGSGLSHSGKPQDNVRMDILESDARQLCGTISDGPIKWLIELNFGVQPDGMYPRLVLPVNETEDADKKAALLSIVTDPSKKVQITSAWMRGLIGAPDPKPGDLLIDGTVYQAPVVAPVAVPAGQPAAAAAPIRPTPVLPTPPEPFPGVTVTPATVPITTWEGDIPVPPYTPPSAWGQVPVMPYAQNRVGKRNPAELMAQLKTLSARYKSEDYKARTMARMDAAIKETESVTALLAKELKGKK